MLSERYRKVSILEGMLGESLVGNNGREMSLNTILSHIRSNKTGVLSAFTSLAGGGFRCLLAQV
jgi:hypothetical protein